MGASCCVVRGTGRAVRWLVIGGFYRMGKRQMNDPLYALRSYDCPLSRKARDSWLDYRASQGMPAVQHLDRFDGVPVQFQKQFAAMRDRKSEQNPTKPIA